MAYCLSAPPTRLSVDDEDYDHDIGLRIRVMLDGEEANEVVAYDIERGIVTTYAKDEEGQLLIENEEYVLEDRHGDVTVEWRD